MMYLKKYPKRKLLLFIGDLFFILLSLGLAYCILFQGEATPSKIDELLRVTLFIAAFQLVSFYIFDLYDIRSEFKTIQNLILIGSSLLMVSLFALAFFSIFPSELWRRLFLINLVLTGILISVWRLSYSIIFQLTIPHRNILIVGPEKDAEAVRDILGKYPEYRIKAAVNDVSLKSNPSKQGNKNSSLEKIINEYNIDDIIVTSYATRNTNLKNELITWKMKGVNIYDMLTIYEDFLFKVPVSYINERWIFDHQGFQKLGRNNYQNLKRVFDIVISLGVFTVLLPLGIVISIAVKLSSKGSIFFIQERVGKIQQLFPLIKFRTMVQRAENDVPKWADREDPRVTAVGKVLRKIRLDELPQLINVLKGEMSVVGPRPERSFFVKDLTKKNSYYSLRFSVKPGITGWAQVHLGYTASERESLEKLEYDLYYIKNMSLFLDIKILLKTMKTILFGKGR